MRLAILLLAAAAFAQQPRPVDIGGIYPHLAMFNEGSECGTGAVVPWAGRLWVVTYSPHQPGGSSDKLYEIDAALNQAIRPESIGGTPANRMIHRESGQLFIGPYAIDARGNVRAIPYSRMFGRPTGNARHLTRPAEKIYYATMEEGFYEVDARTLEVKVIQEDGNSLHARKAAPDIAGPLLPGYHGKGLYSGQGRLIYANNGDPDGVRLPPTAITGCLAEWDGKDWQVVRRGQFTEVSGPGGIYGNPDPERDPIWSIGWDYRSLVLLLRDNGRWHAYRLPKASHTYDGAHGWNTEWPRIRDIGETDLLMTMHGMLWRFPRTFTAANSAGILPRSTYLKVVGDFARWRDRIVFGCDDAAKSEFLNTRRVKAGMEPPGQSQSNLWFVEPRRLDRLGVPLGRGGVWVDEPVRTGTPSDPFLFAGFDRRMVHLTHSEDAPVTFTFEVDRAGNQRWSVLRRVTVPPRGYRWITFSPEETGAWVRVIAGRDCARATVYFQFTDIDRRTAEADPIFAGLARPDDAGASTGLVWAAGENRRTLFYAAADGLYELDAQLQLRRLDDPARLAWMRKRLAVPADALEVDAASLIYTDEAGRRWRLPKGDPAFERAGPARVAREIVTERDLLNAHGTFYELPANNAGGIAMVRPIATHNRRIHDFCSYRGMVVLSGVASDAAGPRIARSGEKGPALWLGVADELWGLGKPRGIGGPWRRTQVRANQPSDPYLMTGYHRKRLQLSHDQPHAVQVRLEVDLTGTGLWRTYGTFTVPPGETLDHHFDDAFQAYWLRTTAGRDCLATALLTYE